MDPNNPFSSSWCPPEMADDGQYGEYTGAGLDSINLNSSVGESFQNVMGGDEDSPSSEPAPAKAKGKQRGKNKGKTLANVPPLSRSDADAKPKRRAYTVEQGTAVAQIWKEETCNSIIGRDQSGDKYWGRVADRYNAMFNDDLNTKTVKSFFGRISHRVKEWMIAYDKVDRKRQSGASDDMVKDQAQELYHAHEGTYFKHFGAWEILADYPKFLHQEFPDVPSMKRTKNTAEDAYTSSGTPHGSSEPTEEEESSAPPRPQGRDAAKAAARAAKGKGKKKQSEEEEFGSMVSSTNDWLNNLAAAKNNLAEAMRERARAKQDLADLKIINTDTSNYTPEQMQFHMMLLNDVKRRRGWA